MNRNSKHGSRKLSLEIDDEQVREIAYRLDPVLWVREILQYLPDGMAGDLSALAARGIHSGVDGAASRQDHHRGVGDCAFYAVYTRSLSVIACPAQRQSAEAVRRVKEASSKPALNFESDTSTGSNLRTGHGCWRCRAAMILSGTDGRWLDRR